MAEKNIKTRIIHKHDIETNWLLATNFTPKQGEIIVYDIDENHSYERIKIGDGVQNVNALPFVGDDLKTEIDAVDSRIDAVSALVGDTPVSDQINSAINEATADDFGIYVQDTEPTNAVPGDIWVDTSTDPSFVIASKLPEVTTADNGKVLMVVDGVWTTATLNLSVDDEGVVSV